MRRISSLTAVSRTGSRSGDAPHPAPADPGPPDPPAQDGSTAGRAGCGARRRRAVRRTRYSQAQGMDRHPDMDVSAGPTWTSPLALCRRAGPRVVRLRTVGSIWAVMMAGRARRARRREPAIGQPAPGGPASPPPEHPKIAGDAGGIRRPADDGPTGTGRPVLWPRRRGPRYPPSARRGCRMGDRRQPGRRGCDRFVPLPIRWRSLPAPRLGAASAWRGALPHVRPDGARAVGTGRAAAVAVPGSPTWR
ncbi:hypothetical protein FraQA3DRAFT_0065 [Frankia sp. QA3]|nr:hypothetical protein FraQA3DRAFT_0065 [Frankia sp. QA3]